MYIYTYIIGYDSPAQMSSARIAVSRNWPSRNESERFETKSFPAWTAWIPSSSPCPPRVLPESSQSPPCILSAQWKRKFSKPDFLSTVGNGRWGAGTQCQCRSGWTLVKGMWRRVYFVWNWKIFELQIKLFAGFCMGGVLEYAWMKFAVLVFEPADECP